MKSIRASEIGAYLYCQRAWWYREQGIEPENQFDLTKGVEFHHQHGQRIQQARWVRVLAFGLIGLGLAMLAYLSTSQF